jgi:hypothetical protein
MEVSGQHLAPASLPQGKEPPTHGIGAWAGPRAGLDDFETKKISFPCRDSNPWPSSSKLSSYTDHSEAHNCTTCVGVLQQAQCAKRADLDSDVWMCGFHCTHPQSYELTPSWIFFFSFPPACRSVSLHSCRDATLCPQITDAHSHDCTPERQQCQHSLGTGSDKRPLNMRSLWFEECQTRQMDGQINSNTNSISGYMLQSLLRQPSGSLYKSSWNKRKSTFIHLVVCYDRSKASSKAGSPHSAIQSFLPQMRVSSPFLNFIQ